MEAEETLESREIPIMIIQNKLDKLGGEIAESQTQEHLDEFVITNHFVAGFQTSAKTNTNIDESITCLIKAIIKFIKGESLYRSSRITQSANNSMRLSKMSVQNTSRKSLYGRYSKDSNDACNC